MNVRNPEDMILKVADAMAVHDLDQLLNLYEPDAIYVRADGTEAVGVDQIREEYAAFIDKVVSMQAKAIWSHVSGDIASVRGRYEITLKRRDGSEVTSSGEPIETLRRQADGSWLYLIDNGSGANATND